MANRPVFIVKEGSPYYYTADVDFSWNGGFARSQKQKNITALHDAFTAQRPGKRALEISSKSMQEGGVELSAFNLKKYVPSLGRSVPVECVYQAGKVFSNGGPYLDLLEKSSREAKQDERLHQGRLLRFEFDGKSFPLIPETLFYNYLYMTALLENPELAEVLLQYDAFTDIEFNPQRSISSQAGAAAVFVSLTRMGLIDRVRDPDSYLELFRAAPVAASPAAAKPVAESKPAVGPGTRIIHAAFGEGVVLEKRDTLLRLSFPSVGEKILGFSWCIDHCKFPADTDPAES